MSVSLIDGHIDDDVQMTEEQIIKALERCKLGDDCDSCEYEPTEYKKGTVGCCCKLMEDALDLINHQKAEIERLTEQRDKAVKGFEEFARRSYLLNPFACRWCAHSIEDGRACLWKGEHEDESCLGRHFEYRLLPEEKERK